MTALSYAVNAQPTPSLWGVKSEWTILSSDYCSVFVFLYIVLWNEHTMSPPQTTNGANASTDHINMGSNRSLWSLIYRRVQSMYSREMKKRSAMGFSHPVAAVSSKVVPFEVNRRYVSVKRDLLSQCGSWLGGKFVRRDTKFEYTRSVYKQNRKTRQHYAAEMLTETVRYYEEVDKHVHDTLASFNVIQDAECYPNRFWESINTNSRRLKAKITM